MTTHCFVEPPETISKYMANSLSNIFQHFPRNVVLFPPSKHFSASRKWKPLACRRSGPSVHSVVGRWNPLIPHDNPSQTGLISSPVKSCGILGRELGKFRTDVAVKASSEAPNVQSSDWGDGKKRRKDGSSSEPTHYQLTKEIIEISMLSAISGLAFYLSTFLRVDAYFACFFPLPLVIASLHWSSSSGLKALITTFLLITILGGPLKALSYIFMHGFHGLSMGISWSIGFPWILSVLFCTLARFFGLLFSVFLASWLLKKNLFYIAMVNSQTFLIHMLSSMGSTIAPSLFFVYVTTISMVLLNCIVFVILLHVLYATILPKMGINIKTSSPSWAKVKLPN